MPLTRPSTTARATSAAGSGSTAGAAGSTTVTVPSILQIKAPLIGGGELDFATFAGKPLAVWFWAPG